METDTDTEWDTGTINSDAESLTSEEDLDVVNSIIEEAIQTHCNKQCRN